MRHKYSEWWLVLIDFVSFGEWEQISIQHDWDKVVLIDPQNPRRSYEIKKFSIGN